MNDHHSHLQPGEVDSNGKGYSRSVRKLNAGAKKQQGQDKIKESGEITKNNNLSNGKDIEPKDMERKGDEGRERGERGERGDKRNTGINRKPQLKLDNLFEYKSYRDLEEYQSKHVKLASRRKSQNGSSSNGRKPHILEEKIHLKGMSFINVHYKFVVDYRDDYAQQKLDPNIPVSLDRILRIIVPKGNACPICLSDEPVAPRMITSCGHILCLTCLLSLLTNEVPVFKKRENQVVPEKYRDCPLCFSVIREHEIKPVLIENIDERFEVPKINDEVILTLMTRSQNSMISLPSFYDNPLDDFPMADDALNKYAPYLRIFKGDLKYLLEMYLGEQQSILKLYQKEKELYNDDGKFVHMALNNIKKDIEKWEDCYSKDQVIETKNITKRDRSASNPTNVFYYFQTGFNASSTYVLSPLDVKVLKTCYKDYANLPSSIIAKVENIKYDELTTEAVLKRHKYLSHLPLGTSIGFIECDWSQNEYINKESWELLKDDLIKRSKFSSKKFRKEERDKKRALNYEEMKTRTFFERENLGILEGESYPSNNSGIGNFGSLSITDHRDLPPLTAEASEVLRKYSSSSSTKDDLQTTVWGTKIPKSEPDDEVLSDDDWDAHEFIRKAKEEFERQEKENSQSESEGKQKKKKKKKLVLLSSNSSW